MPFVYCEYTATPKPVIKIHFAVQKQENPGSQAVPQTNQSTGSWFGLSEDYKSLGSSMGTPLDIRFRNWLEGGAGQAWLKEVGTQLRPKEDKEDASIRYVVVTSSDLTTRMDSVPRSSDPALGELRKAIVQFSAQLFPKMHGYCDDITRNVQHKKDMIKLIETEYPSATQRDQEFKAFSINLVKEMDLKGAFYGSYEYAGTPAWDAVMSNGPIAGFMAAHMQNYTQVSAAWEKIRGTGLPQPRDYAICNDKEVEAKICAQALELIANSCSVLFEALAKDDANEALNNRFKSLGDQRDSFRQWAINSLQNLQKLAAVANHDLHSEEINEAIQSVSVVLQYAESISKKKSSEKSKVEQVVESATISQVETKQSNTTSRTHIVHSPLPQLPPNAPSTSSVDQHSTASNNLTTSSTAHTDGDGQTTLKHG